VNPRLIDIDIIFEKTNQNYHYLLKDLGIPQSFDLSKRNNKRLYTHTFLKTFMDYLKENDPPFYFYSNVTTKDHRRNTLVGKIKRIFKIPIWEECGDLQQFEDKVSNNECAVVGLLEVFFATKDTPKFKRIKSLLEKEGLTMLNDVYFEDLSNKLSIFIK
jgi:hypothetical protein